MSHLCTLYGQYINTKKGSSHLATVHNRVTHEPTSKLQNTFLCKYPRGTPGFMAQIEIVSRHANDAQRRQGLIYNSTFSYYIFIFLDSHKKCSSREEPLDPSLELSFEGFSLYRISLGISSSCCSKKDPKCVPQSTCTLTATSC